MKYSYNSSFHKELHDEILNLIKGDIDVCNEDKFNNLALREFQYQFHNNELYRKYCEKKYDIYNPTSIDNFLDIPAIPADAFKRYKTKLISFPEDLLPKATIFRTSRTTSNEKGEIARDPKTMNLYNLALNRSTKEFVFPDVEKMKIYLLAHNSGTEFIIGREFGEKVEYVSYDMSSHKFSEAVFENMKRDGKDGTPIAIFGPTIVLLRFLNYCQERDIHFSLAEGSRIISGGGYRSFMKIPPSKSEILELEETVLGIKQSYILDVYSSNEKPSLIYDNSLRNAVLDRKEPRYKPNLPWTRTLIVDPKSYPGQTIPVKYGEMGLIKQYDLADMGSLISVYMGDSGINLRDGFEILGKADGKNLEYYKSSLNDFSTVIEAI